MDSRKGLFAAFADDDEETTLAPKAAPKKTQPKPAEEKKERPQTTPSFAPNTANNQKPQ
jgi:hypothetical protein